MPRTAQETFSRRVEEASVRAQLATWGREHDKLREQGTTLAVRDKIREVEFIVDELSIQILKRGCHYEC